MAKTKLNIEEEDTQKENPTEEIKEETAAENKERVAEEVTVTAGAKKVKVQVVEDVNCIVACVPYNLKKDKAYLVPSDVAAILCNAKKAYRI
nr:MAG TPA: hypothetical protein [Caudoviricetes sp.]